MEPLIFYTSQPTTQSLAFWDQLFPNGEGPCLSFVPLEKNSTATALPPRHLRAPLTRQPLHFEGILTKNAGWAEGRGTQPHPGQVPQLLPPPWLGGQGFRVHPAELPFLPSDWKPSAQQLVRESGGLPAGTQRGIREKPLGPRSNPSNSPPLPAPAPSHSVPLPAAAPPPNSSCPRVLSQRGSKENPRPWGGSGGHPRDTGKRATAPLPPLARNV